MSKFGQDPIPGMQDSQSSATGPEEAARPPDPPPLETAPAIPKTPEAPEPSNARLSGFRVLNGPWAGDVIDLPEDSDELQIGRNDPPAVVVDIDLTEAELGKPPMVSRRHAVLRRSPSGMVTILDDGSTNGTWVNRVRLQPGQPSAPIGEGALVRFANIELVGVAGSESPSA